jgi:hypothetical protein
MIIVFAYQPPMITPVSRQMWRTLLSKGESCRTAGRLQPGCGRRRRIRAVRGTGGATGAESVNVLVIRPADVRAATAHEYPFDVGKWQT